MRLDEAALLGCCASKAWAKAMARAFETREELLRAADDVWFSLGRAGWLEAFAAHPKIGDRRAGGAAAKEQAGARGASAATLAALDAGNRAYEKKFGFTFIVCATGKSADEMLDILRSRLENDAEAELRNAAVEQGKITRIRLEKLL